MILIVGGGFCPPGNIWQCLGKFLVVRNWEGEEEGVATNICDAAKDLKN